MTREDQESFVRDLCCSIANEVTKKIATGQIPEEWDGHELRVLLAEKFKDSATMSTIVKEPRRARARNYRNIVLTNNL